MKITYKGGVKTSVTQEFSVGGQTGHRKFGFSSSAEKETMFIPGSSQEFGPWSTDDEWVDTSGVSNEISIVDVGGYYVVGGNVSASIDVDHISSEWQNIWGN